MLVVEVYLCTHMVVIVEVRVGVGSGSWISSVEMNPYKFITRQFSPSLEIIASKLHVLIHGTKSLFNLETVDASIKFNQCSILMYNIDPDLK